MAIKVTRRFKDLKNLIKNSRKNFNKALKLDIADEIIKEILQGKSPVRGHRFVKYSDMYSKRKGRKAPVDMLKDGDLLESIEVSVNTRGSLEVAFTDEKAEYHQKGKGNLPVRKLLPQGNERFNIKLTKFINKALSKAVKKTTKRR